MIVVVPNVLLSSGSISGAILALVSMNPWWLVRKCLKRSTMAAMYQKSLHS